MSKVLNTYIESKILMWSEHLKTIVNIITINYS